MSKRAEAWKIVQAIEPDSLVFGTMEDEKTHCACPAIHVERGLKLGVLYPFSVFNVGRLLDKTLNLPVGTLCHFMLEYDHRCEEIDGITPQRMKQIAVETWRELVPISDKEDD